MKNAVLAALLLLPGAAFAQNIRVLDTAVLEFRGQNDNNPDDYGVGINKLYLSGEFNATSVNAQIDSVGFTGYPDVTSQTVAGSAEEPSAYADDARIERITAMHRFELGQDGAEGTVALGDSHLQLGRGLVLSLRKVDELGTDQALRGGLTTYESDGFAAKAFAGRTNIANLDGVTQRFLEDPDDVMVGGSGTMHLGRTDLSVHGMLLQLRVPTLEEFDDDQTVVGGAYLDMPATDWLSVYLEGAVEQYRLGTTEETGTAAYASTDLDLQFVSLLLEGLYLDKFQVAGSYDPTLQQVNRYNLPPTLERIDQEVLDNENVKGGRAKLSRAFYEGALVLYTSGMFRQYGPEAALVDALHGYGGFELYYGLGSSRWFASGGYREEIAAGDADAFKTMVHGETDWVQAVGGGYALHITVGHEARTLEAGNYSRGTTLLGFDRTGLGSLMAEIGYDTFNPQQQQLFLAGIIAWEAADWFNMRAVVGSQRGGIKCIGGVCRDFPAFNGVRFEASVQHDMM